VSPSEAVAFYRLYAGHCIEISRHMADPANKAALIVMAQAWMTLADQVEKYGETIQVDETPSPRFQSEQVEQQQQQQQSQPGNPGKKHSD
jgi:extradiol dioxygenase family protein